MITIPDTLKRAPQRKKMLDLILLELEAGRSFPNARWLAEKMGWRNRNSARDALETLVRLDRVLKRDVVKGATVYSLRNPA